MVLTSSRYMSNEDEDGNYLDIIQSRSRSYSYLKKRFKIRRLICRVCKLKFRTRQETQAHIKREHRRYDIAQIIIEQVLDWCGRETDGMESDLCYIPSFTWYSENRRRRNQKLNMTAIRKSFVSEKKAPG